jgi:para-aminobenzoate synthetase/4-amino-4-deoxychorismate lyase
LGLLPGVLRAEMISGGNAVEANLSLEDLPEQFFVGNALRGLMPATRTIAEVSPLSL